MFGHRGITHSLVGLAIQAVLLAFAFRGFAPGISPGLLAGFSAAGLVLHSAFDCLNPWGPALLAPFSPIRFSLDWVGETDAFFLLVPAVAFAAGIAREPMREKYSRAGLGIILAYSFACAGSHAMGLEQARAVMSKISIKPDRVEAFPRFLDPLGWNAVAWTADRIYQADVGTFSGIRGRVRTYFRVPVPPALKSAFTDRYMEWARVPVIRFTAGRYPDEIVLCDLRFTVPGARTVYAALISHTSGGTTRRWLGGDEPVPSADMEFALPTQ